MCGKREAELSETQVDMHDRGLGREITRDSGSSLPLLLKAGQVLPRQGPGASCGASTSASARLWP